MQELITHQARAETRLRVDVRLLSHLMQSEIFIDLTDDKTAGRPEQVVVGQVAHGDQQILRFAVNVDPIPGSPIPGHAAEKRCCGLF